MTAPSAPKPPASSLHKMVAVARVESLRQLGHKKINELLDALVDMSYVCNSRLTTRERVCRFCNELEALKDVPNQREIGDIVDLLRSVFGLEYSRNNSRAASLYEPIKQRLCELDESYPTYRLYDRLRPDCMFLTAHGPAGVKAEVSQLIAKLFVIAMNAENEQFHSEVKDVIQQIMDISFEWM